MARRTSMMAAAGLTVLTGLGLAGNDGFAKFLETSSNPRGGKAGAPMPAYTLSAEDAAAVAAYLKTLP
jgi:mono/diheme cytochrome c family protein